MIVHVVLFSPRPDLTDDQLRSIALNIQDGLRAVPGVSRAAVGRAIDVNPGYSRAIGNKTYNFAAVLEFVSREDLIVYLRDPRHEVIGKMFWEFCGNAIVTEYEMISPNDQQFVEFLVGSR